MPIQDLIPRRGPRAASITWTVERELGADDIMRLLMAPRAASAVPALQKLTAMHHRQAQLLARGHTAAEVAVMTGRTAQIIRDRARDDPQFRDLVTYYREQRADSEIETTQRIQTKLADAAELAVEEIGERVADPARRAKMRGYELIKIAELGLDRTVAPPKTAVPTGAALPPTITLNFGTPVNQPGVPASPTAGEIPPSRPMGLPAAAQRPVIDLTPEDDAEDKAEDKA